MSMKNQAKDNHERDIFDYEDGYRSSRLGIFRSLKASDLKLVAAIAIFIWGWILIYSFTAYQPKYVSKSIVMIKDSAVTNRYVDLDQAPNQQTTTSNASNPVLNTMGLLKSAAIKDSLWDYFDNVRFPELNKLSIKDKTDWTEYYGNGNRLLKAKNLPGTDLISMQFTWSDPMIAREGLRVILKAFQEASLNLNRTEYKSRSQYLDNQVDNITKQLEDVRQKKSLFKSSMKTASILEEQINLTRSRIELEISLNQVLAQARGKQAETSRYQQMVGMTPHMAITASAIGQNATMAKLQDQLYALSESHAFLKATLTDKHPKVKELSSQIEQVKNDIQNEVTRTVGRKELPKSLFMVADPTRGTVVGQMAASQAEASNLRAMANSLRNHLEEMDQKLQKLPDIERELANIEQQERVLSQALDTLNQKRLEAHLKEAQTLSNVFIVDDPQLPISEKFPTRTHLIVLGLMLSIAGGVIALMLKYQFFPGKASSLSDDLEVSRFNGKQATEDVKSSLLAQEQR